jgi:cobalt-zinc-cadmium efflux system membrane fusion protein
MRTLTLMFIVTACLFLASCGEGRRPSNELPTAASEKEKKGPEAGGTKKDTETGERKEAEGKEGGRGEAKEGAGGRVEMSAAAQRRIGLAVAPAKTTALAEVLTLTGTVQPIDGRVTRVRPLARGRLLEVLAKVGDRVREGQVLARFDNIEAGDLASQYNTAQAELARLRIQQAVLARQAERSRKLASIGAVPQKELEAIEAERQGQMEAVRAQESTLAGLAARLQRFGVTESNLAAALTASIQAPFAGVVTAVHAGPGEVVDSSSELFSVADLSRIYIVGQVYEKDLGRVRVGQAANILVASFPDVRFAGRVASISPQVEPQTRTASVRIDVANSGERLRLEMFATVELPTANRNEALTVPVDAIQRIEAKPVIFVRQDETHFEARAVQLGRVIGGLAEITNGLKVGEPVVTKGSFNLKSTLLGKELAEEDEAK